ncbi:MAG: GNAT family N-acetyltransferase [Bacteriovorax sp.]|nr:GNAT family N-acetyltransferase [Bacteriovorax sp.]
MEVGIDIKIQDAGIEDVDEIINLYRSVYGQKYPISYGTDPDLLKRAIEDKETHKCLVARDVVNRVIAGALIVEIDAFNKIGKMVGLVVHPTYQRHKIGNSLVAFVSEFFLKTDTRLNSLYATTRTISVGPQMIFIKNDYLPLGIFPNAHRLHQYETVTLFAKFRPGILEKRKPEVKVSNKVIPLYDILKKLVPQINIPSLSELAPVNVQESEEEWEFEIIRAPNYVLRKFIERFPDPNDRFFPFHSPNMIVADKKGRIEIFAYFSKRDGYCTLIKSTRPITELNGRLSSLYMQLDDIGVSYIEVLVNVEHTPLIDTLLSGQFLPSAIYPAMREVNNNYQDYIVMSRTMEPLNFRGMAVVAPFKPFIDQYVDAWKQVNLDTIEVIYGPKT